jgi:hypothetical protein
VADYRIDMQGAHPLAELALLQDHIHCRLMELTPTDSTDLQLLWQETRSTIDSALQEKPAKKTSAANRIGLPVSRNRDLPGREAPAGAARAV